MKFSFPLFFLLALNPSSAEPNARLGPIPVKVVVVAMFENGTVEDGNPGEFELWVKNEHLDAVLPFPLGWMDLRMNQEEGVLGVVTGEGATNATATIMALGTDPRFDLSKSYWLIAGIAGADPLDATLGTAAWAEYVLDGDLIHEIDGREIPPDWPYGKMPLSAQKPNQKTPASSYDSFIVYKLNQNLVDWAYKLTEDHPLADRPELAEFRARYQGYPKAVTPPTVIKGDSLGSSTYWHGDIFNQWANDWVKLYTGGKGNFVMTNMEDNGTLTALYRLAKTERVDKNRILVLRSASNFSTPPPGEDARWHFSAPYVLEGRPAIEAAWKIGRIVLRELVDNWGKYEDKIPE